MSGVCWASCEVISVRTWDQDKLEDSSAVAVILNQVWISQIYIALSFASYDINLPTQFKSNGQVHVLEMCRLPTQVIDNNIVTHVKSGNFTAWRQDSRTNVAYRLHTPFIGIAIFEIIRLRSFHAELPDNLGTTMIISGLRPMTVNNLNIVRN